MSLVRVQKSIGDQHSPLPLDVETALNGVVSGGIKTLEEVMNDDLVAIVRNYDGGYSREVGTEITIAKTSPAKLVDIDVPTIVKDGKKFVGEDVVNLLRAKQADMSEVKTEKSKLMTQPRYVPLLRIENYRCEDGCGWQVFRFSIPQIGLRAPLPIESYTFYPESGVLVYTDTNKLAEGAVRKFGRGTYRILSLKGREGAVDTLLEYAANEWLKNAKESARPTEANSKKQ